MSFYGPKYAVGHYSWDRAAFHVLSGISDAYDPE
jgi:hypothetical protein